MSTARPIWTTQHEEEKLLRSSVPGIAAIAVAVVVSVLLLFGLIAGFKSFQRYQKRADANNQVRVTAIQIRNQAQRVKIAKQKAQIRVENAKGIRAAQDHIGKTLTP